MVFISTKIINGKKRYYLEKSVRLPSGNIKKFSIYLKDYKPSKKINIKNYESLLDTKISNEIIFLSGEPYHKGHIYNKKLIQRLEEIKFDYKKIIKKLTGALPDPKNLSVWPEEIRIKNLTPVKRSLIKKLTKNQLKDVLDRFTVNFTYESNALEGNSLTLKDVTMVLQENQIIKGKNLREIYETINTREAIDLIFRNKLKINRKDILKLHKVLVKNTEVAFGFKKLPNFLIGREIKTTPPERVEKEIGDLIEWYHKDKNMHPLQKAIIFHGRFEKIHPFDDGNGRVGRLLINIILLSNGYAPLIIRKTHKASYFSALEAFDKGYEDKLHRFIIEKYKKTYDGFFKVYLAYLK